MPCSLGLPMHEQKAKSSLCDSLSNEIFTRKFQFSSEPYMYIHEELLDFNKSVAIQKTFSLNSAIILQWNLHNVDTIGAI